jgi:fructose-bisphosphate aldolase class 1
VQRGEPPRVPRDAADHAALSDHISGAILYDETIRQATRTGVPFTKVMMDNGILPGIKVDKGAMPLAGCPGEMVTEGLDGLRARLEEYARLGARFAKWRAVITIGEDLPSSTCIDANAHALAATRRCARKRASSRWSSPEVLMDGDHDLETCFDVTEATLRALFGALYEHNVMLEGTILKASMVVSGQGLRRAGRHRRGRERDHPLPQVHRAGRAAGHRVPLGRPVRRGRDRAPERDEPDRQAAVAAQLLLRPRHASPPR